MPRTRELPSGYPQHPATLGAEIRKRRVDLGLSQDELAGRLGVWTSTLRGWELHRHRPTARVLPAVLEFLGGPVERPSGSLGARVLAKRRTLGLSQARLAKALGIDRVTLWRVERGETQLADRTRGALTRFLDGGAEPD